MNIRQIAGLSAILVVLNGGIIWSYYIGKAERAKTTCVAQAKDSWPGSPVILDPNDPTNGFIIPPQDGVPADAIAIDPNAWDLDVSYEPNESTALVINLCAFEAHPVYQRTDLLVIEWNYRPIVELHGIVDKKLRLDIVDMNCLTDESIERIAAFAAKRKEH